MVVLGGGLVGCETALQLAEFGKQVTVVEMRDQLCPDGYKLHRVMLLEELKRRGVVTRTGCICKAVLAQGVMVENAEGAEELLACQGVVNALGMKANIEEAHRLQTMCAGLETYLIGDCVQARKIYDATQEGYQVGLKL